MIAAWMLYCSLCALGLALAAVLAERALLAGRGPVRLAWVSAIALSLVVPAVAFRVPSPQAVVDQPSVDRDSASSAVVEAPLSTAGVAVAHSSTAPAHARSSWRDLLARADRPLGVAWLVLSSLLGVYFVVGILALSWMRGRWERRTLSGVPVFVSQRTGPAVVGAIAPAIVVPEWALAMNPEQLALMLRHEHEHQRARDGQLLIVAQLAAILMPWNIALWWQLVRLRVAIELDCDARVLKSTDARSYGNLLLEVARPRQGPRLLGVTAFAERATQLERRIRVLAHSRKSSTRRARAIAITIGLAALSAAWVSPHPPAPVRTRTIVTPAAPRVDSSKTMAMPASTQAPVIPASKVNLPVVVVAARPCPGRGVPITCALDGIVDSADLARIELKRMPGPGDSIFNILFSGITLSTEHARDAHDLLDQLAIQQSAQDANQASILSATVARSTLLQAQRDTALRALLTNDADRATLDAHLAQPSGGRGRSGGPGAGGRGGADPVYVIDGVRITGDSLIQRMGLQGARGGARGGGAGGSAGVVGGGRGGGRGGGAAPSQAILDSMTANMNAMMSDLTFRRLFNGISLTADQESAARLLITSTQNAIAAGRPRLERAVLKVNPITGVVAMRAESAEALVALASNDADRATVRSRIMTIPNP